MGQHGSERQGRLERTIPCTMDFQSVVFLGSGRSNESPFSLWVVDEAMSPLPLQQTFLSKKPLFQLFIHPKALGATLQEGDVATTAGNLEVGAC